MGCQYRFKKGKNIGKLCGKKFRYCDNEYCYDHYNMIQNHKMKNWLIQEEKRLLEEVKLEKVAVKKRKYNMDSTDPGCQVGFIHSIKRRWMEENSGLSASQVVNQFLHQLCVRVSNTLEVEMYPYDRQGVPVSDIMDEIRGRGFTNVYYNDNLIRFSIFSRGEKSSSTTHLGVKKTLFDNGDERSLVHNSLKLPE